MYFGWLENYAGEVVENNKMQDELSKYFVSVFIVESLAPRCQGA